MTKSTSKLSTKPSPKADTELTAKASVPASASNKGSKPNSAAKLTAERSVATIPVTELAYTLTAPAASARATKQEQVLTLLAQSGGVTIDEVMRATGWQEHSVRGFFAGTVRKKLGFELTSEKAGDGHRSYAIKVAA